MHIFGAKDFAGFFDFRVGGQSLFDQATHLFFVRGVPLYCFDNQAVGGSPCLLG
jgi:hypothetical protein